MSLRIEWRIFRNTGTQINPTSVTLTDPTGLYGVRRKDTHEIVVAAGQALASGEGGNWFYEFAEAEPGLQYEYYLRVEETTPANNKFYIYGKLTGSVASILPHTLGWCRKKLVDISGRYDLVADAAGGDYTDLGLANWYLNSAQQRLDNLLQYNKSTAWLYKELPANTSMITFQQCRFVKEVYEQTDDSDQERTRVTWWTLNVGLAPEQREAVAEDDPLQEGELVIDWTKNIVFGEHYATQAVYVEPSDTARLIVVEAEWYSRHLTDDADKSFWTVQHPQLLVRAAQREMEVDMRNSQGVNDMDQPLLADIQNIYRNLVAEEMAGPSYLWRMY